MNRRTFSRSVAAGALGAATGGISSAVSPAAPVAAPAAAPYKLSVMLWTVFENLPFERAGA